LRRAVKGLPHLIESHAHLGIVEAAAGNTQLARWHLTEAADIAARLTKEAQELSIEQRHALKLAQDALKGLGQTDQ